VPLILTSRAGAVPNPTWLVSEPQGLRVAVAESKPLLIDFGAEWCAACKELERFTFSDQRVIELSKRFVPVRVDATRPTPEVQALMKKYGIIGLPWVAFVAADGTVLKELSVTGFIDADAMLARMQKALPQVSAASAGTD